MGTCIPVASSKYTIHDDDDCQEAIISFSLVIFYNYMPSYFTKFTGFILCM